MAVTSKLLRKLQIGQETVKGTKATATQVLIVDDAAFDLVPVIYNPSQDIGLLADRHPGLEVQRLVKFSIEGDISYEQILYWLNLGMKKVLTGTGAGADKTWTFAPAAAGADDILTGTLETRHSDGGNNIDRYYTYCMLSKLTLSGALGGPAKFKAEGFAKDETSGAITAALTTPANFQIPPAESFKIFSDASWATLGNTQVSGQLYAWTWELDTGLSQAFYIDGVLTMTRHRRRRRSAALTLSLDQEASAGLASTFRTRLTSRALSYLELDVRGATLGAGTYRLALDGTYGVDSVSPPADHEGEDSVTVKLMTKYDTTGAQDIRATVINADATLT